MVRAACMTQRKKVKEEMVRTVREEEEAKGGERDVIHDNQRLKG